MNGSDSIDAIMNEMNNWAKSEGRFLAAAFWEIPPQPHSIGDVPLTPEGKLRIATLRGRRLERRKQAAELEVERECATTG